MDWWSDPCLIVNRGMRFEHGPEDVRAAAKLIGPQVSPSDLTAVQSLTTAVQRSLKILPTAFGRGMPRTLSEILGRRGGNCVSFSVVATVVLRASGFPTRLISETVYTNISLLRGLGAVARTPIGPLTNGHVWLEVRLGGDWIPVDAELGLTGTAEWLARRLASGVTLPALGLPVREHWKFPLRILRLGPDGQPFEDATAEYLIDAPAKGRGDGRRPPEVWSDGVKYFSRNFRWEGRSGLRILAQLPRLRRMSRALDRSPLALGPL